MLKRVTLTIILVLVVAGIFAALRVSARSATLVHNIITVSARDYKYVDVYASEDSTIKIIAYIFTTTWSASDIDIQILRPDGSVELAKQRYRERFIYEFTASTTGTYRILLDNTFSILTDKVVDISITVEPPPSTVTVTLTNTETTTVSLTETLTRTITKTETETQTETLTKTQTATEATIGLAGLAAVIALIVGFLIGRRTEGTKPKS